MAFAIFSTAIFKNPLAMASALNVTPVVLDTSSANAVNWRLTGTASSGSS